MKLAPPPLKNSIGRDVDGKATTVWAIWFQQLFDVLEPILNGTIPGHYHSELVIPGTSVVALRIDTDGSLIFPIHGWKVSFTDTTRTWYKWDGSAWVLAGDTFVV